MTDVEFEIMGHECTSYLCDKSKMSLSNDEFTQVKLSIIIENKMYAAAKSGSDFIAISRVKMNRDDMVYVNTLKRMYLVKDIMDGPEFCYTISLTKINPFHS